MKTHYEWVSRKPNEKEYTRTLCGKKDPLLKLETTLRKYNVDCKDCLKRLKPSTT